jgi:hypothetical protein
MARYSAARLAAMLQAVDSAATNDARGTALEDLTDYLFTRIRGVTVFERDRVDNEGAHELDLLLWNDQLPAALPFLEAVLLIECKADANPGERCCRLFIRKLRVGVRETDSYSNRGITGSLMASAPTADS